MAKLVQIQSNITVKVTAGLQCQDVTNPDAHVADRLKVAPLWPKHTILIRQGAHNYPAEIKEWPTVKALAKDKVLTIGQEFDSETLSEEEQANVDTANEAKQEFRLAEPEQRGKRKRNKGDEQSNSEQEGGAPSLADLAGEDGDEQK